MPAPIRLVAFDADDTLWHCQDHFDAAQLEFEALVAPYLPPGDNTAAWARMHEIEGANIAVFGYGVKGLALSMVEAAIAITDARIGAVDLHRIVEIAKRMLREPVVLFDGVREAVADIAADFEVVLITKGDLFHQEAKVRESGLASHFRRIEIVSEKDEATYARLLDEFGIAAPELVMVGNSLRSDIAPVLALGGWGVHMPYHTEWVHDRVDDFDHGHPRLRRTQSPREWPDAVRAIARAARG